MFVDFFTPERVTGILTLGYVAGITACMFNFRSIVYRMARLVTQVELLLNRKNVKGKNVIVPAPTLYISDTLTFPSYEVRSKTFRIPCSDPITITSGIAISRHYPEEEKVNSSRIILATLFLQLEGETLSEVREYDITDTLRMFHGIFRDFHHKFITDDMFSNVFMDVTPNHIYEYLKNQNALMQDGDTNETSFDNVKNMVIFYKTSSGLQYKARPEDTFYTLEPEEDDDTNPEDNTDWSDLSGNDDAATTTIPRNIVYSSDGEKYILKDTTRDQEQQK
jgi:hypothetical protein